MYNFVKKVVCSSLKLQTEGADGKTFVIAKEKIQLSTRTVKK